MQDVPSAQLVQQRTRGEAVVFHDLSRPHVDWRAEVRLARDDLWGHVDQWDFGDLELCYERLSKLKTA